MPAPIPQGTTEPPMAHELRETLLSNFMTYSPPPSAMDGSSTQSSSRNADEKKAGYDRIIQKPETWQYYQTIMSQFSNLVLIATFAGGVQVAVLSLMNDLLSSLKFQLFPGEGSYSTYSLGILFGILAVVLNLTVAVVAAVNAALASHLSLRPEQKAPNIEARLIFCMIVLFGTAVVSGSSLILLSIDISHYFAFCVGALFLSGVGISILHILELFSFHWLKRVYKTPLSASSLILSTVAFIFAVSRPTSIIWLIFPYYLFTLIYHLFADFQNIPSRLSKKSITFAFVLGISWTVCSIMACLFKGPDLLYTIPSGVASGLEAITFASISIVGSWKIRRRPRMNLVET